MRNNSATVCFALTALFACSGGTPESRPQPDARETEAREPVRVHPGSVHAISGGDSVVFSLVATFTNRTPDTLHFHPCSQNPPFPPVVHLERREGDTWKGVWSPVCTQALMLQPPSLAPGTARVDTLSIWASRAPDFYPQFSGPVAGTYRIVYGDVYKRWYGGNTPPNLSAGSNPLGELAADSVLRSGPFQVVQ